MEENLIEVFRLYGYQPDGTEGRNDGLSQVVSLQTSISHVDKIGHFKLPLV